MRLFKEWLLRRYLFLSYSVMKRIYDRKYKRMVQSDFEESKRILNVLKNLSKRSWSEQIRITLEGDR